jgi:hypothetical protein
LSVSRGNLNGVAVPHVSAPEAGDFHQDYAIGNVYGELISYFGSHGLLILVVFGVGLSLVMNGTLVKGIDLRQHPAASATRTILGVFLGPLAPAERIEIQLKFGHVSGSPSRVR